MKSKLFSRFDLQDKDNEQFVKDLHQLLGLSEEQREFVLSAMPSLSRAIVKAAEKKVLDDLESQTHLKLVDIGHAVDIIRFFTRKMLDDVTEDDTPEAWAADLQSLKVLDAKQAEVFSKFLTRLKSDFLPELATIRKGLMYGAGILPSIKGGGTTVELRGVFDKTFSWGTSVEEYAPELRDLVAVVSVHLIFDQGLPDEIWFQATQDEIDLLISELQAARKQADMLKSRVTLSSD